MEIVVALITFAFVYLVLRVWILGKQVEKITNLHDELHYPNSYLNERFKDFIQHLLRMEMLKHANDFEIAMRHLKDVNEENILMIAKSIDRLGKAMGFEFEPQPATEEDMTWVKVSKSGKKTTKTITKKKNKGGRK